MRQTITIFENFNIPVGCPGLPNPEEMCNYAKEHFSILDRHGNEIEPTYGNGCVKYYAEGLFSQPIE